MISVRGGFSDKRGMNTVVHFLQIDEFDDRTRVIISNSVRNLLEYFFEGNWRFRNLYKNGQYPEHNFCKNILSEVFCQQLDLPYETQIYKWRAIYDSKIYNIIYNAPYNEVLDIVEFICDWLVQNYSEIDSYPYQYMNIIFENECVGYRFVNEEIVQITDQHEVEEIEAAAHSIFEGSNAHIAKAVSLLADRELKDYKNSVKESISAVESVCKIIVGKNNAQLGEMLKVLESKRGLKGPLKSAFEKLYNYTNDRGGIRHAEGLFVSDVTFEEAKFMLVSCSAFYGCSGLTSVTIPDSVTSIGNFAFSGCGGLTNVTFENSNGWLRVTSPTSTNGTSISNLSNSSTAATYLKSTYQNYYWKRG